LAACRHFWPPLLIFFQYFFWEGSPANFEGFGGWSNQSTHAEPKKHHFFAIRIEKSLHVANFPKCIKVHFSKNGHFLHKLQNFISHEP
jgi:hypothetical protein